MPVQSREEKLVMKTYALGPEDPYPPFQRRAHGDIYPYSMLDDLGEEVRDVEYRALVLENEYLRVVVMPELGGHLHSAVDKATGEELFYHNHVVKPGLIALRGAWLSGGIEWNFPKGHTVTTMSPVDSRMVRDENGSATIWVGDVERRHRMAWAVGIRLHPKSSVIETEIRLSNSTALPHPYYFWANAAVPARDDMRLIYPATRSRTWQGETAWPVHEGRDLSRYQAFEWASDSFMLDSLEDFFGVHYHERDFGVVHVANVHESFGKKYFTWGTADAGRMWASILSDDDGPYCEIQSGRFVDQGTFRLLPPHHSIAWTEYWYPVKGIGGFAWANEQAAVRLSRHGRKLDLGVAVTLPIWDAAVEITAGARVLHRRSGDLLPDRPLRMEVPIEPTWPEGPYTLIVTDPERGEAIRYTEEQAPRTMTLRAGTEKGEAQTAGALLRQAVRTEELGGRETAVAAYQKALDADPACVEAMIAAGRLLIGSNPRAAGERLATAAAEAPERADAAYYLGVALRRGGRLEEAEVELWRAVADPAFAHAARVELGQIEMQRGDWNAAGEMLTHALHLGHGDARVVALTIAAARKCGETMMAHTLVEAGCERLPLDRLLAAEAHFCANAVSDRLNTAGLRRLRSMLPDSADPWLELAFDYSGAGMRDEAVQLLQWASRNVASAKDDPLTHYALAFWLEGRGAGKPAAALRQRAAQLPTERVFPHHWELEEALRDAVVHDPGDATARHYLGVLLYSQGRREEALAEWEAAAEHVSDGDALHRNLGLAYREVKHDLKRAEAALRQAAAQKPSHQRVYLELEDVLRAMKADPRERLAVLDTAPAGVQRRSLVAAQQTAACVELAEWDRAILLLTTHEFHRWEAEFRMRGLYVSAFVGRGSERFDRGDMAGACADFDAALEYPTNLRIGRPAQTEDSRPRWCVGLAREALGETEAARAHWEAGAAETYLRHSHTGAPDRAVYKALCLRKLGKTQEAEALLAEELGAARERAEASPDDARSQMTLGLALKAAGKTSEANAALRRALELYPWLPTARRMLEQEVIL